MTQAKTTAEHADAIVAKLFGQNIGNVAQGIFRTAILAAVQAAMDDGRAELSAKLDAAKAREALLRDALERVVNLIPIPSLDFARQALETKP